MPRKKRPASRTTPPSHRVQSPESSHSSPGTLAKRHPQKRPQTRSVRAHPAQSPAFEKKALRERYELWATGAKEGAWQLVELEIKRALRRTHPELEQHLGVLRPFTREFGLEWLRHYAPLAEAWLVMMRTAEAGGRRVPDEIIALGDVPHPILIAAWARWLQQRQRQFARRYPENVRRRMSRLAREISTLPLGEDPKHQIQTVVQILERSALALRVCLKALQPFLQRSKNPTLTTAVGSLVRAAIATGWSKNKALKLISANFDESFNAVKARARRARSDRSA